MKLSYMLKREDFYKIFSKTINDYNTDMMNVNSISYYAFPHLNAIVKDFRSSKIKNYIRTEYSVKGNFFRRTFIRLYIELVFYFPLIFSSKKIMLRFKGNERNDVLIYPCNQRLRVFYFDSNRVDVLVKYGFNPICSHNEIDFRNKYLLEFVPSILSVKKNYYSEKIIDGIPLPRILEEDIQVNIKQKVRNKILNFNQENLEFVNLKGYLQELIDAIITNVSLIDNELVLIKLKSLLTEITNDINSSKPETFIPIVVSHGDLQHGNIWLERKTNNVLVFDWESVSKRSIWYDLFFLEHGKRDTIIIGCGVLQDKLSIINNDYNIPLKIISKIISIENISYYTSSLSNFPSDIYEIELKTFLNKLNYK